MQDSSTHFVERAVSHATLATESGLFRLPPRPLEHRQEGYIERFDAQTLVYDVTSVHAGEVVVICPPALNLEEQVRSTSLRLDGIAVKPNWQKGDRNLQLWVKSDHPDPQILQLVGPLVDTSLTVNKGQSEHFLGKRTIFTLSKNNEMRWIADWINFYKNRHKCDSALIYDNGSNKYSLEELLEFLVKETAISTCVLVSWPFMYGPGGGPSGMWDSDYCQFGMLEDARWRFLRQAKSVLNVDVDEYVVCSDGEGIFEKVERSETGYIEFPGRWISNVRRDAKEQSSSLVPRHIDFGYLETKMPPCPSKWACVPNQVYPEQQWKVHTIARRNSEIWLNEQFYFRHFRAISTNWLYRRAFDELLDSNKHVLDSELVMAMESQ